MSFLRRNWLSITAAEASASPAPGPRAALQPKRSECSICAGAPLLSTLSLHTPVPRHRERAQPMPQHRERAQLVPRHREWARLVPRVGRPGPNSCCAIFPSSCPMSLCQRHCRGSRTPQPRHRSRCNQVTARGHSLLPTRHGNYLGAGNGTAVTVLAVPLVSAVHPAWGAFLIHCGGTLTAGPSHAGTRGGTGTGEHDSPAGAWRL